MIEGVGRRALKLVTPPWRRQADVVVIVMVMKRSHRIALKPTPEQETLFGQHAGYARFAYNWALGEFKAGLDVGEWLRERTVVKMVDFSYTTIVSHS